VTLSTDLAERIEIESYTDFALGARDVLGVATQRFDQALAMATRHDSTGFWSKAGGFGPVTRAGLAEVGDFFRSQGVATASIAIAPDKLPADWPDIRESLRLADDGRYVKMVCEARKVTGDLSTLDPALRVAPVDRRDAEQWASVMMTTFEMTDRGMTDMAAAAIGRPGWRSYAVWEGDEIVAVGSIFRYGDTTNLCGGATVPRARRRGAQTALVVTLARAAHEDGARWLTADTAADTPTNHNSSLHNLHRSGFRPLYERTNWLWRA
jgi:GNAT superfamily N-acetyltransferase